MLMVLFVILVIAAFFLMERSKELKNTETRHYSAAVQKAIFLNGLYTWIVWIILILLAGMAAIEFIKNNL